MSTIGAQLTQITNNILEEEKEERLSKHRSFFGSNLHNLLFDVARNGSTMLVIDAQDNEIYRYINSNYEEMKEVCEEEELLLRKSVSQFEIHWI